LKILFEDEFEEYLFARWADYIEQLENTENRLNYFEFEEEHKDQLLQFFRLSKINEKKSDGDFQEWLSKNMTNKTLH
jgi:hypothetical protein